MPWDTCHVNARQGNQWTRYIGARSGTIAGRSRQTLNGRKVKRTHKTESSAGSAARHVIRVPAKKVRDSEGVSNGNANEKAKGLYGAKSD